MEKLRLIGKSGACLLSRSLTQRYKMSSATPLLLTQQKRNYADPGKYIQVERDTDHEEIAVVTMMKNPRNSMTKDFMTEMNTTLEKLENDSSCRGVILTSSIHGFFSSGLDAPEMYQKSPEYISAFWRSVQDLWMRLYGSRLVTVAAINGYCAAGALMMALSCDYRVLAAGNVKIGLYAVNLGIVSPFWFKELLVKTCGERQAEMILQLANLFTPEQALKIGMVDEVVPVEDVVNKAREELVKWLMVPDGARVITKGMCRGPLVEKVRAKQEEEIATFTEFINKDAVQNAIGRLMATIKDGGIAKFIESVKSTYRCRMEKLRAIGKSGACLLSRSRSASQVYKRSGATPLLLTQQKRYYADPGKYIQVERDTDHEDIAIVRMNKKANSLCRDFMRELIITLEKLENNQSYRGAILTSAQPGIFSAGLDINELYQKSDDYTRTFFDTVHELVLRLYGTDLAMVAAINGHAPAGGCMLACFCDYRIMSQGDFIIGLNETMLGVVAPYWLQEMLANLCGKRQAEMDVQKGTLHTPEEALKLGMVDEVVPPEDVFNKAREELVNWLKIPDRARTLTKQIQRGALLDKLRARLEEQAAFEAENINNPITQEVIGGYLSKLKSKKLKHK
ncbi:uncharacterized protein LOC119735071 [Patiria miniata]|uniref:Enoyl-CoA delta isomerase 1, mitochondrial n=1 Tax=Patiria miniata TaxID=46514 RepID=A0A914AME4_PATMI|nr:uncharacterized protein LOC119735071 [Patiria miniata]